MNIKKRVEFIEVYLHGDSSDDYQWFDNRGELIRCKNCKWWNDERKHENGECYCYKIDQWTAPQFYCADGERRDQDAAD